MGVFVGHCPGSGRGVVLFFLLVRSAGGSRAKQLSTKCKDQSTNDESSNYMILLYIRGLGVNNIG